MKDELIITQNIAVADGHIGFEHLADCPGLLARFKVRGLTGNVFYR